MDRTPTCLTLAYAQTSRTQCDFDLQARDMVVAHDTLFCHDNHLCQMILNHARQRYGSDTLLGMHNHTFHGGGIQEFCGMLCRTCFVPSH